MTIWSDDHTRHVLCTIWRCWTMQTCLGITRKKGKQAGWLPENHCPVNTPAPTHSGSGNPHHVCANWMRLGVERGRRKSCWKLLPEQRSRSSMAIHWKCKLFLIQIKLWKQCYAVCQWNDIFGPKISSSFVQIQFELWGWRNSNVTNWLASKLR